MGRKSSIIKSMDIVKFGHGEKICIGQVYGTGLPTSPLGSGGGAVFSGSGVTCKLGLELRQGGRLGCWHDDGDGPDPV